ncbi:hypothetical protein [Lysobacter gummosus]
MNVHAHPPVKGAGRIGPGTLARRVRASAARHDGRHAATGGE